MEYTFELFEVGEWTTPQSQDVILRSNKVSFYATSPQYENKLIKNIKSYSPHTKGYPTNRTLHRKLKSINKYHDTLIDIKKISRKICYNTLKIQ